MTNKALHILLVEDNKGDVILTLDIFHDLAMNNTVSVVEDGEQAIKYIDNKDEFTDAVPPDLILLDINMPRIDGKEVLNYIQQQPHLQHIPVIMLVFSMSAELIFAKGFLKAGAKGFVSKDASLEELKLPLDSF